MTTGWHKIQRTDDGVRCWTWVDGEATKRAGTALAKSAKGKAHRLSVPMAGALLTLADEERARTARWTYGMNTWQALEGRGLVERAWRPSLTPAGSDLVAGYDIDRDHRPTKEEVDAIDAAAYAAHLEREKTRDKRAYIASVVECGCVVGFASFDCCDSGKTADDWRRKGFAVDLLEGDEATQRLKESPFGCDHEKATA